MSIIVLEGPDGAGKTTVAAEIRQMVTAKYHGIKCGPPTPGLEPDMGGCSAAFYQYLMACEEAQHFHSEGMVVVIDRLHVGELVYGPILRGHSGITIAEARSIDHTLGEKGGLVRMWFNLPVEELRHRQMIRDGGATDTKSGAGLAHLRPIRATYEWLLGGQEPALPGWVDAGAHRYPDIIAQDILDRSMT